ncbi:trp operon leader peptide [Enterobacter hormaechei]
MTALFVLHGWWRTS